MYVFTCVGLVQDTPAWTACPQEDIPGQGGKINCYTGPELTCSMLTIVSEDLVKKQKIIRSLQCLNKLLVLKSSSLQSTNAY